MLQEAYFIFVSFYLYVIYFLDKANQFSQRVSFQIELSKTLQLVVKKTQDEAAKVRIQLL